MEDGSFGAFAANVNRFPVDSSSVFIRSLFNSTARFRHPRSVPGFASTQLVQLIADFNGGWEAGVIRGYADLVLSNE